MICNNTEDALALALDHAHDVGLEDNLLDKLKFLNEFTWFGRPGRVHLFKDFSPYGFAFTAEYFDREGEEWKFAMNGGLLYYGCGDTGIVGPQFSVRLDSSSKGWEIHS